MKRSEIAEQKAKELLVWAGVTLTDPRDLSEWMGEHGVWPNAMSGATGAPADICQEKQRTGAREHEWGTERFVQLSKPLTRENYPDGVVKTWDEYKPNFINEELVNSYDALPASIDVLVEFDALYRKVFGEGREIDLAGFGFWLWKLTSDKMSWDELEGHLRASAEYAALTI